MKSKSKSEKSTSGPSAHPDVVARAVVDTTVAIIPAIEKTKVGRTIRNFALNMDRHLLCVKDKGEQAGHRGV